ncbi:hypothetical protein CAPTEDRAFT_107982, partial [Capitella teleta]
FIDALDLRGNACRNPDGDERGPWCFVNAASGYMAYCDIPACREGRNKFCYLMMFPLSSLQGRVI